MIVGSCVLCERTLDDAVLVGTRDRDGREIQRVDCVGCRLVQAHPRPTEEQIAEHYRGTYWRTHPPAHLHLLHPNGTVRSVSPDDGPAYEAALDAQSRGRMGQLAEQLKLAHGARVLEVGCADGRMLAAMLRGGWDPRGIEPDAPKALAAMRRLAFPIHVSASHRDGTYATGDALPPNAARVMHGDLLTHQERLLEHGPFDAVVSFHVVEHLHDPLAGLLAMRRVCKPGGLVWLEVPDLSMAREPLDQHWWQWVHLCDFTPATLEALMHRAGFVDVTVRQSFAGLQAVGRHDPSIGTRSYEAPPPPPAIEASVLDQLLTAQLNTLTPEQAHEVRVEMKRWVESVGRLHDVWRSSADTLEQLGLVLEAQGMSRMTMHHEDPWHFGFMIGEAFALLRTSKLLALVGSAMRLREHRDEQHEEAR